jgi:hypothetical protein
MTPVQAGAAPASPSAAAALGFLLPTCWEIEVTCAAAMILVALYAAYELLAPRPASAAGGSSAAGDDLLLVRDLDGADKYKGGSSGPSAYVVKVSSDRSILLSPFLLPIVQMVCVTRMCLFS